MIFRLVLQRAQCKPTSDFHHRNLGSPSPCGEVLAKHGSREDDHAIRLVVLDHPPVPFDGTKLLVRDPVGSAARHTQPLLGRPLGCKQLRPRCATVHQRCDRLVAIHPLQQTQNDMPAFDGGIRPVNPS